jgi:hypothetical protein
MKTTGVFLLISLALPGVVSPQTRAEIKEARNMQPGVTVRTTTEKTKAALVDGFTRAGYSLQNDSAFLLVFTKPAPSSANIAAFMFGAGTSDPQEVVRVILIERKGTTRVTTSTTVVSSNRSGRERSMDFNSDGRHNLRVQKLLETGATEAEKPSN